MIRTASTLFALTALLVGSCAPAPAGVATPAGASAAAPAPVWEPAGIFLTWTGDPTTSVSIDWHTVPGDEGAPLEYRPVGGGAWQAVPPPERIAFPFSDRTIHRVGLGGLAPDSEYRIRFGPGSREFTLRTMPSELSRPVRFAAGGDLRHSQEWMEQMSRVVMRYDPDFILVAGDLAYADGRDDRVYRWHEWFDAYRNALIAEDGRLVPMLLAPGNHEVRGGYWFRDEAYEPTAAHRARIAPYYFSVFAFPGQPGYGVIDVGDYLSVLLLDSDHTGPIEGAQTAWLERTLRARRGRPHLVPTYHVPAYPSVRPFAGEVNERVRDNWVPLFERYGVRTVFEAHDHAYKRTHPIRDGAVADDGIVYIGDGAWGVGVREIGSRREEGEDAWYMLRGEAVRHAVIVTLEDDEIEIVAVSEAGEVFDQARLRAPTRAAIH
jgi:acid phosphatase type 7